MNTSLICTKFFAASLLLCFTSSNWAAAPDDISNGMRAWFDAYDINGNDDFSDNPASGASIGTWVDKSGNGNNVSHVTAARQPTVKTSPSTNYGVKFNGGQRLFRIGDVWTGTVDDVDIFAIASTDVRTSSWLVSSAATAFNQTNRIGNHTPWSDGNTYWDRGACCGSSRLSANIAISIGTERKYLWNFYASSTGANAPFGSDRMYIMQNGNNSASNTKTDSYTPTITARFALGANPRTDSEYFNGTFGETILYQRTLSIAERNIINSYLFARWQAPGNLNRDQYDGDDEAGYYYHVGGIGRASGDDVNTGTSLGLTIERVSGGNNRYHLAGLKDLTPPTGTVTTNVPATVASRAARDWYLDRSPNTGNPSSRLTFDLAAMGITATAGDEYALLFRSTTGTDFTVLQQTMLAGSTLSYTISGADDGFYTIGKIGSEPEFILMKTVTVDSDPVTTGSFPKAIPLSEHIYTITISNAAAGGTNEPDSIVLDDTLDSNLTFFTGDLDGNGSPIDFVEGSPTCALSFNFDNFASTTDNAAFYDVNDVPVTSVSGAYDPNIRRIELTPQGSFAVNSGSNEPSCQFKYKVRLE